MVMNTNGGDNTAFGRVDADGTVYVRTVAGDRAVGSWQAGSPEEGLAHFARRYDDLVTEVELLETRLASGAADPQHTQASVVRLQESLPEVHAVGDLDAVAARLEALAGVVAAKAEEQKAARAAAREQAAQRKRELVAEAELIAAESTQWNFAGLDAQRKQAQAYKEELVTEAESLAESSDWTETANRLKQLMADWKAAGRAPKDAEEQLWKRFRAAQDQFFGRRSEVFSERDAEYKSNQEKKEALLVEAEAIDVDTDVKAAQAALRDIHQRWESIGRVPRE